MRIRHMQIIGDTGNDESALIAVYWISDGIDCCRVGFLPRHLLKQLQVFDGPIAQVIDVYKESESPTKRRKNTRNCGWCEPVLIDNRDEEGTTGSRVITTDDLDDRTYTISKKNYSSAKQQKEEE